MKATANLRERGQSVWLDNITRALLQSGALRRYIDELSVTGLTLGILSCARSRRAKDGLGATSTKFMAVCRKKVPHRRETYDS